MDSRHRAARCGSSNVKSVQPEVYPPLPPWSECVWEQSPPLMYVSPHVCVACVAACNCCCCVGYRAARKPDVAVGARGIITICGRRWIKKSLEALDDRGQCRLTREDSANYRGLHRMEDICAELVEQEKKTKVHPGRHRCFVIPRPVNAKPSNCADQFFRTNAH